MLINMNMYYSKQNVSSLLNKNYLRNINYFKKCLGVLVCLPTLETHIYNLKIAKSPSTPLLEIPKSPEILDPNPQIYSLKMAKSPSTP